MSGRDDNVVWGIGHMPYDWDYYGKPNPKYCDHKWIDTGMRLTFCKKCDARGRLDPLTGAVEFLPDAEDNPNTVKGSD